MIRHGKFMNGSPGFGLTQSVGALTVAVIEAAFKASLMTAASLAPLRDTSPEATGMAAIAMPPVAMGTDEEHGAAIGGRTKLLVEGEFVSCRHPGLDRARWTEAPSDGNIVLLLQSVLPQPWGD